MNALCNDTKHSLKAAVISEPRPRFLSVFWSCSGRSPRDQTPAPQTPATVSSIALPVRDSYPFEARPVEVRYMPPRSLLMRRLKRASLAAGSHQTGMPSSEITSFGVT